MRPSVTAYVLVLAACSSGAHGDDASAPDLGAGDAGTASDAGDAGATVDAGVDTGAATVDDDHDGLADADELRIVGDYLPYLSVSDMDHCPRSGILFRLRPHPDDPTRLAATIIMLYENDCGASGHIGDDEVFGMTIDPSRPAPDGILAIRTISHQGTPCELVGECGTCTGFTACTSGTRRGVAYPAIFASRDKHGWYASETACDGACFFTNYCDMSSAPAEPMLLNAGEPGAPLVTDLTDAGLVTAANGWTQMTLFHFDPWSNMNFGGAGNTTSDLGDPAFLTPGCP